MKIALFLVTALVLLNACQSASTETTDSDVSNSASQITELSPPDAQTKVSKAYSQFIDVRTVEEYAGGHAARAVNIPLDTLIANLDRLEKNEPVYLICQTGNRSKKAAVVLKDSGFGQVFNIAGGTMAWNAAGLPMEVNSPHKPIAN